MNEKRASQEKLKHLIGFLMGDRLPKWIIPATGFAALAPVIAHALEEKTKKETPAPVHPAMYMRSLLPAVVASNQAYQPVLKYSSAQDMTKLAAGLSEFSRLVQEARQRGSMKKSVRTLDSKPSVAQLSAGKKPARGHSSGTGIAGNGGGYGK